MTIFNHVWRQWQGKSAYPATTWRTILTLLLLLLFFGLTAPATAQQQQCRTAPVGTSTEFCASEAFVTNSLGRLPVLAFASLPSCSSAIKGQSYFITDSNVSTLNATITAGGGVNLGLAVCNGTNWTFH
jgi:hypothetical protein